MSLHTHEYLILLFLVAIMATQPDISISQMGTLGVPVIACLLRIQEE